MAIGTQIHPWKDEKQPLKEFDTGLLLVKALLKSRNSSQNPQHSKVRKGSRTEGK